LNEVKLEFILNMRTTPQMIASIVVAGFGLIGALEAEAQKNGKAGRAAGNGNRPLVLEGRDGIDGRALGDLQGAFEAWQRMVLGGAEFYSVSDRELRERHTLIYASLRSAAIEDRLTDEQTRELVDQLLAVGAKAKVLRGQEDGLSEQARVEVAEELRLLAGEAQALAATEVQRKALTPRLNRMQVSLEELFRFGVADDHLSKGQQQTLRRKFAALEGAEAEAKEDKDVDEREGENLWEEVLEIARDTAELLRR
jgi:hypothetical protein